jgi:hypothetical protein
VASWHGERIAAIAGRILKDQGRLRVRFFRFLGFLTTLLGARHYFHFGKLFGGYL